MAFGAKKYCSTRCRSSAEREKKRSVDGPGKGWAKGVEFAPRAECEICSGAFRADPGRRAKGKARFCSVRCRTSYFAQNRIFPTAGKRGRGGRRADLGNAYFRSRWEANYARYLNWLKANKQIVDWEYEPSTFEFPVKRGSKFYTPDFLVTEKNGEQAYHEVKGYMDQKSATKMRRMKTHFPKVRILVIDKNAYSAIAKNMGGLPNWE